MTHFDILILAIVGCFALLGFFFGFFHALGSILGIALATFLAGKYFQNFGDLLQQAFRNEGFANVLAFIIIFVFIFKVVGIVFSIINKIFDIISIIPFLQTFNRLFGAVLGLVEGVIAISAILYITARYPINDQVTQALMDSNIAPLFVKIANLFSLLLPDIVNRLESI